MRTIESKIKFVIFGFSVIILLFLFYKNDFGISSQVVKLQVSNEDYQGLKDSRIESNLENTFEIKVDDYVLPYDETTNSFMYPIDSVKSINENNPKFKIVMENNFDYEVAIMKQPITKEMIDKNESV